MFRLAILFGLLGLAAVTGILVWSGTASILAALKIAGWGILWTSLYHVIPIYIAAVGWRVVLPDAKRPSSFFFLYLLWLRGAVNNLMPVARVGGEIVSVRVMMKHGLSINSAITSTVVELTLSIAAMFFVVMAGIVLLSLRVSDQNLGWKLAAGLVASMPLIAVFVIVQRIGFFGLLDKIFTLLLRDHWKKMAVNMAELDAGIHALYRQTPKIFLCFLLQFVSWSGGAGDIWLGLHFLGHPLPLLDCFILEAMIQGTASAAFAIPGALGVQEAGFLFFGHMLGLPSEIAVALAVIRRCRDLILYLPGLICWQIKEGKWLLTKKLK